eukprot:s1266_g11.t2
MKSGSINVCSTPAAMLAPRQFGRPSETLESETPRTGEKSGVTTLEPTCFGKSSDSSSTKSSLSPRKIGAEGPSATPAQQVSEGNEGFFPEVKDVEEGPAELAPAGAHADVPSQDAQPKGKGKGGKGKAPPPKAKPKATRTSSSVQLPKAAPASGGMSALLERVKAIGEKKDLEESKEIGDIDLSQIDPSAKRERVKCPRCEKDVLEEDMASHMTAHSSEACPNNSLFGITKLANHFDSCRDSLQTSDTSHEAQSQNMSEEWMNASLNCACQCLVFASVFSKASDAAEEILSWLFLGGPSVQESSFAPVL